MTRWKSFLLKNWRAKIASLVVATLVWFVLRHANAQASASSAAAQRMRNFTRPGQISATAGGLTLAFQNSGVEKLAVVFPPFYVEF